MDNTTLENSIREEAARAIAAIKEKEALEIRQMDDLYSVEMENFRKQVETETEIRIRQEISKLENRAILERRKTKLRNTEQFINGIVDEVMKKIRHNPNYRQFLLEAICDGVKMAAADVDIKLNKEDIPLEKDVLAAIAAMDGKQNVVIAEDPNIKWGGCLVWDKQKGRIFNNTLERIYFRKSLLIRRKAMSLLMKNSQEDKLRG